MRRLITILFVLCFFFGAIAGTALAQDSPGDGHDCAGTVTSSLAGPGFGQIVAFFCALAGC